MLLSVKNLNVRFEHDGESVSAVDGIDFTVGGNEIVGLVGESGSGKTVTALSIMKLLPEKNCCAGGGIIFGGKNILTLSEREALGVRGAGIAMVFQEPFTSLNPVLTVGEQIDEAILTHKRLSRKSAGDQTLRLLEEVKIKSPGRIYDSYPHLLSGGERQRAIIAMAIALRPKLLIADEPTTALDVVIQKEILELILELKRELNMAVLFITHDFGVINKVADRVLVMKEGKIIERARKAEIFSAPKNEYTKKLLEARMESMQTKPPYQPRRFANGHLQTYAVGKVVGKAVVSVRDLNKSFSVEKGVFGRKKRRIRACSGVNLEIKEGRTLGLVGESGSGKTTLGKLLVGLLQADSGCVSARCPMQIVFQDPHSSLDPRMRMQDIVLEGLTIRKTSRDKKESILRDILFKVHMSYKSILKYPHQFSGGQKQRIAIARALAVSPRILILDEPVSSLDVITQREVLDLLKELQQELSLTYLFISHDLRAVAYMADEVAVMENGKIVELASREAIYTHPEHPYTKKLLASLL